MRRLFVPACLCVMTLSSTTGFDLPLKATASTRIGKETVSRKAGDDTNGGTEKQEIADADPAADGAAQSDTAPADIPTEMPANVEPLIATEDVPLPPKRKPVVTRSRAEICDTLVDAAETNDLPIRFFIRLLLQESGFRPDVVSPAGAQGIAQFMPETAEDEGLANPFDPLEAIPASARLLRKLHVQFGNLGLAAAAYNAGAKRIDDWLHKKGDLPRETQGYVKTITGKPADNWRLAEVKFTPIALPQRAPCKDKVPPLPPQPPVIAADKSKKDSSGAVAKTAKPQARAAAKHRKTTEQLAARKQDKKRRRARN